MNHDEGDIRGWLRSVAPPPARLDADEIRGLARARARRRRYRTAGSAAAVMIAAALALPAAVGDRLPGDWPGDWPFGDGGRGPADSAAERLAGILDCHVTVLPVPPHPERGEPPLSEVQVRAVDPTGRYVLGAWPGGEASTVAGRSVVLRWDDGEPAYLPVLRGGATGRAVNADGVTVGDGRDADGEYAWIYADGHTRELPPPPGHRAARALAVNAAGEVVGTATGEQGEVTPVVWPTADLETPEILRGPAGAVLTPVGITDDGVVAASITRDGQDDGVYVWDADGTGGRLPLGPGVGGYATAVRGGWVVGVVHLPAEPGEAAPPTNQPQPQDRAVPARWNLATGAVDLSLGVGGHGSPGGVTRDGAVLLRAPEPVLVTRPGRAYGFADQDGGAVPLVVNDDGTTFAGLLVDDVLADDIDPGNGPAVDPATDPATGSESLGGYRGNQPAQWDCG